MATAWYGYGEVRFSRPVPIQWDTTRRLTGMDNANATTTSQARAMVNGSGVGDARPTNQKLTTSNANRRTVTAIPVVIFTHRFSHVWTTY